MMHFTHLLLLVAVASAAVDGRHLHNGSGVVKTILEVEKRWLGFAVTAAECPTGGEADCKSNAAEAEKEFTNSCTSVLHTIVHSCAGEKLRVKNYLADVCGDVLLKGELAELCSNFGQLLTLEMSESQHENKVPGSVNSTKICAGLFHDGYLAKVGKKHAVESVEAVNKGKRLKRAEMVKRAVADAAQKNEEAARSAKDAERSAEALKAAEAKQRQLELEANAAAQEANRIVTGATPGSNSTSENPDDIQTASNILNSNNASQSTNATPPGTKGNNSSSAHRLDIHDASHDDKKSALLRVKQARKSFLMTFPLTFS